MEYLDNKLIDLVAGFCISLYFWWRNKRGIESNTQRIEEVKGRQVAVEETAMTIGQEEVNRISELEFALAEMRKKLEQLETLKDDKTKGSEGTSF